MISLIKFEKWPCKSKVITSKFGPRWGTVHPGIDIAPIEPSVDGDELFAPADGMVVVSKINGGGLSSGYGYYSVIQHNGFCTLYGHQRSLLLKVGQTVKAGQVIGYMGHTGNCISSIGGTGTHLHFGLYEGDYGAHIFNTDIKVSRAINPEPYFNNIKKEVIELNWKEIIKQVTSDPERWEEAINVAVAAAKADGDLGTLEIFKFLPKLIEKIYSSK